MLFNIFNMLFKIFISRLLKSSAENKLRAISVKFVAIAVAVIIVITGVSIVMFIGLVGAKTVTATSTTTSTETTTVPYLTTTTATVTSTTTITPTTSTATATSTVTTTSVTTTTSLVTTTITTTVTPTTTISPNITGNEVLSLDWAGYVVVSDYQNPQSVITGVNGSWIVPSVSISQNNTLSYYSALWIGIGGFTDRTLIQCGTEQDSVNGQAQYFAWFELLPMYSRTIMNFNVSPGDKIVASITLVDPTRDLWLINLNDTTTTQAFHQNVFYRSSMLSAEWIVERPTFGNQLSNLTNFGSASFSNATAIVGNKVGAIGSFPYYVTIMHDSQNNNLTNISPLTSDGLGFTVDYLPNTTLTQITGIAVPYLAYFALESGKDDMFKPIF